MKIQSKKSLVIGPQPSDLRLGVGRGVVAVIVINEGVEHQCELDPEEATGLGVMLLKLAGQVEVSNAARSIIAPGVHASPLGGGAGGGGAGAMSANAELSPKVEIK